MRKRLAGRPVIESNLTKAGWLLLIVSLVLLFGAWYLTEIVFEFRVNKFAFFIGGGVSLIGGGAALLNKLGFEIIK